MPRESRWFSESILRIRASTSSPLFSTSLGCLTRRVKHPSEVLNKGDEVEALILKIDSENQRLSLGIKQLQPNALEDFFRTHGVGDILSGKIVRLAEFGAFVEVFEGVEGLVHVYQMSK